MLMNIIEKPPYEKQTVGDKSNLVNCELLLRHRVLRHLVHYAPGDGDGDAGDGGGNCDGGGDGGRDGDGGDSDGGGRDGGGDCVGCSDDCDFGVMASCISFPH